MMLPQSYFYTTEPKMKNVTKEEFEEFIKNYPRKLTRDVCGISEPPSITYNDFELANRWPHSIVARTFMYTDDKKDRWYCPEEERTYAIMENYEEVFMNKTGNKANGCQSKGGAMKLSDELKHCLYDKNCGDCRHYEADTKATCKGLLEKAYERIKGYEELEEQGRLHIFPCNVGDTVYILRNRYTKCSAHNEEFEEYNCQGCESECDSRKEQYIHEQKVFNLEWIVREMEQNRFGKLVFLTREQAEAELKKNEEVEE